MPDDRIRFEEGGNDEHGEIVESIFGGSSADITRAGLADTYNNSRILNKKITSIQTSRDDLGSGPLRKVEIRLEGGNIIEITGDSIDLMVLEQ